METYLDELEPSTQQFTVESQAAPPDSKAVRAKPSFFVTNVTMKRFLTLPKPADAIALYAFLSHTASIQGNQSVWCLERFIAGGLRWSRAKVGRVKRQLRDMGLIETIARRDGHGHFTGHFLRVRFLMNSPVAQNTTSGEMSDKILLDTTSNTLEDKSKEDTPFPQRHVFQSESHISQSLRATKKTKSIPATWKPSNRSRGEQLAALPPWRDAPTQDEFNNFLEERGLWVVSMYRENLYRELCEHKGRHWNSRHNRWFRIRDWKSFVAALDAKIFEGLGTSSGGTKTEEGIVFYEDEIKS